MKTQQATFTPSVLDWHLEYIKKLLDNGVPVELDANLDDEQIIPRTSDYDLIFDGFSQVETVNQHLVIRVFPNPKSFTCDKYVYTPLKEEANADNELHPAVQKMIKEHAHLKVIHEKLSHDFDSLSKENHALEKKLKKKSNKITKLVADKHNLNMEIIEVKSSIPKNDLNGILNGVVQAVAENPNILNIFKKEQPLSGVDTVKLEDTIDHYLSQNFTQEEAIKISQIIIACSINKKFIDSIHKHTELIRQNQQTQ